jgi:SET domain-containing protein
MKKKSVRRTPASRRGPARKQKSSPVAASRPPRRWWTRGKSRIHRHGLFAARDIPRGTRVIEYVGPRLTKAEGWRRADAWLAKSEYSGKGEVFIFELNSRWDIDGNVPWNTARHINHSCRPNCEAKIIRGHIWIVALRRIPAGAELTYDYGYDLDACTDHPCRCGEGNCVGYIVGSEYRAKLRRLLERERRDSAAGS